MKRPLLVPPLVFALLSAAGAGATPPHPTPHQVRGQLYSGTAPGRYRPSFYVDPGLYGIGMGGAPGTTSISLCSAQGATAKIVSSRRAGSCCASTQPASTSGFATASPIVAVAVP